MAHHTAINDMFDNAPAKLVLRGDKKRKPEPAMRIIEFPGGAIEVSRLDDGTYWAHILLNRKRLVSGNYEGFEAANGEVIDSRIDWDERRLEAIPCIPDHAHLTQIAVHIKPLSRPEGSAT